MKKLGIIGGAGPLASALLYETLIQESYALGYQIPEIVLINYPLLTKNEVELGILACNTLHLFLKQYHLPSSIQFYHLPELVIKAVQQKEHHRLLILGTQKMCHSHLYQFSGIQAIYPSASDQDRWIEKTQFIQSKFAERFLIRGK